MLRGIAGTAGIGALVAIAGAALWVVSASALWSGGTGTPFSPLAWSDATQWWGANWWVNLWLVLAAAVPTIFLPVPLIWLSVLLCAWWRGRRPLAQPSGGGVKAVERGITDNLGHAAWATRKQLDRHFSGPGCLIGAADRGGRLLYDDLSKGPTHSMNFAGPGSHKTTSAVTRIWTWQGPRAVFDPSCEIGPIMSEALAARGCKVTTIGLNGQGIDVVDWIDTRHPEADAHIRSVVDWIYNEGATTPNGHGHHRDPFWPTWGRALVTCLAAHMLFTEQAGFRRTLAALRRGIATHAVMGALFNAMFHADAVGIEDRILFQIDEAWILGAMKEIKLCHTTARKYLGTISTIWQSEGQMEGVWGPDDAKLMHDTVSWRSYNAIQDGTVAEKLSRDLGEHAVVATSEGDNQGRQKPFGLRLPSSSKGTNVNVHEIKRRLIKGDEIMRAPADEMFVLARDFPHPIRCVSAPYFRYPDIARVMGASRFNTTAAE
jgi:type IV secretory pathway TraG/TraD family ATPase VirD4